MAVVDGIDGDIELTSLRSHDNQEPSNIPEFEETQIYDGIEGISSEVISQECSQLWNETRSREFYNQLINISKKLPDEKKFTIGRTTSHGCFIIKNEELAFQTEMTAAIQSL